MLNRLVAASDLMLLLFAAAALAFPPGPTLESELKPLQVAVVVVLEMAVFLSIHTRLGGYRVEHYTQPITVLAYILGSLLPAWIASFLLLGAFARSALWEPGWLIAWHLLQLSLLLAGRVAQWWLIRVAERRRLLRRRVVIIGTGALAERVIADLATAQGESYDVLAVFKDTEDEARTVAGIPVAGDLSVLSHYAQVQTIDVIILAVPLSRAPDIIRLMDYVSWIAADVVIPFDVAAVTSNFVAIVPMGRLRALQVMSRPFKGTQGLMKVVEDYAVATIALLILSPVMLLAAIAIRLEGSGPILFRQWRPGYGRKPFSIYKFRTMRVNPNDDATVGTTGPADPRVTRVGAVLRRLSIDELPQLLNVLKGEMSIVGPRPYVADMLVGNERFSDLVNQYAERHRIKPGLTGYAQAHGMRSYALRSPENARRSIEMDLHYMTHWSLWLDLKIMIRTLLVGLAGRNVF
ncbi:sugar transferase [Roseomonas populi]|uniref:Sugar transferase n=1 Tax=Roseomonas populi TaxID=3121582 RepID=A0ABT1X2L2_9PROT|nr:sugar transferase [Roseomonas pecuniae]MCR0982317.1 sugar transferase [Roseomonas pecuniae]